MSHYKNGPVLKNLIKDSRTRHSFLELLPNLNEREQYVLKLRLGIETEGGKIVTLEEIGKQLGCTRERVRQIQNVALSKLSQLGLKMN